MSESSLHRDILDILRDNIADALQSPAIGTWAAGVLKQYASLGLASPFSGGDIQYINAHRFQQAQLARKKSVWDRLHISPCNAPSVRAKLCTYLRWFVRPACLSGEPFYELSLPTTNLRLLIHFRVGCHSLPIEQGMPAQACQASCAMAVAQVHFLHCLCSGR